MNKTTSVFKLEKIKPALRWIFFLPATFAGLVIGGIGANLFFLLQGWFLGISTESGYGKINHYIFASIASTLLAMYWGVHVAPTGKKIIALILAGLIIIISTIGAFGAIMSEQLDLYWSLSSSLTSVITTGCFIYLIFTDNKSLNINLDEN